MDSHECRESIPLENLPRPPNFEESEPPAYFQAISPAPATSLRPSRWPFGPAVFYAFFALFSWIVLCLLPFKPLTTTTYAYHDDYYYPGDENFWQDIWRRNERWYLAARILQAIAGLAVIPVSTAVCGHAAAVFVQRNQITLKQLLCLADRGYASPRLYQRMVIKGFKWARKNGSGFWACATALHVVGAAIWPIQAGLVSSRVIKVQSDGSGSQDVVDLATFDHGSRYAARAEYVALQAGRTMQGYEWDYSAPQLWAGDGCTRDGIASGNCSADPSLERWKTMPDPFFAQLPAGSNTGVRREFIPRVNFTTEFTCLNRSTWEWPAECDDEQALLLEYHDPFPGPAYQGWGIRVCMPPGSTNSPWKPTRGRQDFTETLYINATNGLFSDDDANACLAKIELKTTAGMFEMPNYMNDGKPGPLLADDPISTHNPAAKRE
ncbi:hypothetical protein PHISP_07575 [Aspergillus sp. HF37]|nr:hypothetical protein PHISP_07575 [Aspergillus sp. HF37]